MPEGKRIRDLEEDIERFELAIIMAKLLIHELQQPK